MSLTPSEVASLTNALAYWEAAEYVCAALVTIGCIGEYAADFTNWFTGGIKERKERLAKRSTLLLISALSLELICLVRTNELSGRVIGSLDERSQSAVDNSAKALGDSGKAVEVSDKAKVTASEAMAEASSARHEADSSRRI